MDPKHQPCVVEVVKKKSGSGLYEVATGFLITPSRILTCAHVLRDAVAVRVRFLEIKGSDPLKVTDIWNGDRCSPPVDVAVLGVNPEEVMSLGVTTEPLLSILTPTDHQEWCSRGILSAVATSTSAGHLVSNVDDFSGRLLAPANGIMTLEVRTAPEVAEGWQGASGAPVFNTKGLVAVVRSYPEAWAGRRLKATWLGRVWDYEGFPEAVGLSRARKELERIESILVEILQAHPSVCRLLAQAFSTTDDTAKTVASHLCQLQVDVILERCNELLESLVGEHAERTRSVDFASAQVLESVALKLLPLLARPEVTQQLRNVERANAYAILPLDWILRETAAIQMAAIDGASPDFGDDPLGSGCSRDQYDFPVSPEVGFGKKRGNDPEAAAQSIIRDLAAQLLPLEMREGIAFDDLAHRTNRALEIQLKAHGSKARHWYLLFKDEQDRRCVEQIKHLIPMLRVGHQNGKDWEMEYRPHELLLRFLSLTSRREKLS